MIFGIIKDMFFDNMLEVAFNELKGTFSAEQALEYDVVETKDSTASMLIMVALGLIPTSIVVSNILFFGYEVSFLYIFLANLTIPYIIYKAIRNKINKLYYKVKFIFTLKDNILKVSTDSKVKIQGFMQKFSK